MKKWEEVSFLKEAALKTNKQTHRILRVREQNKNKQSSNDEGWQRKARQKPNKALKGFMRKLSRVYTRTFSFTL